MRVLLILLCALLSGCAKSKSHSSALALKPIQGMPTSSTTNQVVALSRHAIGKVARVNTVARFLVVTFPAGSSLPPTGQLLGIYRNGQKVGEAKVTGPQEANNTVADLIKGEVNITDEVQAE